MGNKGTKSKELIEDRISRLGHKINVKEEEEHIWKKKDVMKHVEHHSECLMDWFHCLLTLKILR